MARGRRVCPVFGCPELRPCPVDGHEPEPWQGSTRSKRLPADWDKRRRFVLRRDPICKDGRVCGGEALSTEVDHVNPGDDHSYANLQGICEGCHKQKTKEERQAGHRVGR